MSGVSPDDSRLSEAFAAVLSEVLDIPEVSVDSNFFDELEADSLVMAHFCARVTKRKDLPSVSIKEVYQYPTIRSLAASVAGATDDGTDELAQAFGPTPDLRDVQDVATVARWQHVACGAAQLVVLLAIAASTSYIFARGVDWISASTGLRELYLRSGFFGGAVFVAWAAGAIVGKWLLVGRWTPQEFRIWGVKYLRFWLAKILVRANPLVLFVGTPLYSLYLRSLGAKVGRNAVILSRLVPACTDLVRIGDNAVVRKDSRLSTYRAQRGVIQTGPVSVGAGAFVGEMTVLDIHTSVGDGAQIGHGSALYAGQSIPDGERRVGCPAKQTFGVDFVAVTPKDGVSRRSVTYSIAQLLFLFAVGLPLPLMIAATVFDSSVLPAGLSGSTASPITTLDFWRQTTLFSLGLFAILLAFRLFITLVIPRFLNRLIKPGVTYPMYGIRYWAHRNIGRYSNSKFFLKLLGDSSYVVYYLHLLGYKLSFAEQTGSNFGADVKHDNPYNVSIGAGTMVADGLSIINADYSTSSFRIAPVDIGARSFFGNAIPYPSQAKTGDNCLHGSKVMVPLEGEVRTDAGFLGSPSFEIPRTVERDRQLDPTRDGVSRAELLSAKNRHNLATIGLFLLSRWFGFFWLLVLALAGANLYRQFGPFGFVASVCLAPLAAVFYGVLLERASIGFKPLRPLQSSIYDHDFWRVERFWKLSWQPRLFNGTPMKAMVWRLLGVKVGKRLFDDGAFMIERTMITIGDDCVLNAAAIIQPHSQEDGSYKSDHITIGDACTVGVSTLVHYGVTMGDGSSLTSNAFLMKGTDVAPHTLWGDNPARQLDEESAHVAVEPSVVPSPDSSVEPRAELNGPPTRPQPLDTTHSNEEVKVMETRPLSGPDYWRSVLEAGENTVIPRWSSGPRFDEYEVAITDDLLASLGRLASDLGVPVTSVFLAGHAKVLAALAGEREIATGYVPTSGRRPLPCRLTIEPDSWRDLVAKTHQIETAVLANKDVPLDGLRHELGLREPSFETVFDPIGEGEVASQTVLAISVASTGEMTTLRLRYRIDAFEAESIARIAGYYLAALTLMVSDPEAEHRGQSLLSPDELRFQLQDLAGPRRDLPDRRFHELFEERVRARPDAVAVVHNHEPLTYGELNARANQLARALVARGLRPEAVVAVVTARNLDWMASVLAIFKAGGVYLPIEPQFPADRIMATLSRSGAKLVLTEQASTETLDQALASVPDAERVLIDSAYKEGHPQGNLDIEVGEDQLAYIYFTSGSTGQPKGAMCEQAGMLNHLYAKIDDLEIGPGATVAEIAPQCFDISLWQLLSALLVGGRTLLVPQETILDPERFINTVVDSRVAVLQVVPSYLEVLLSYLERTPRRLPELRCVSVTGEALSFELTQRWFATNPAIKLVNAYGLTETSDDTNHEVMERAPEDGVVPLGRAVNNVEVRVVDELLSPVPLGAPGEIVFAGVCVGRGYINDPDRTAAAYLKDPINERQRLYRSGDFGRWRPDGKLEYLGRRDAQVKIRGFRIEIGEIENTLEQVAGVRQAAVVIYERADQSKDLVGFYSGQQLESGVVSAQLGRSLPDYMVPSALHWREALPLTDNGKINRKALVALAAELATSSDAFEAPVSPGEKRIATAWASVLGVPVDQVSRQADFFASGGTSLSAVELVLALDNAVSLKDVTRVPVLAELAQLLDGGVAARPTGILQQFSDPSGPGRAALVCLPYAGGNAVNFRAMATELRGSGFAVYAAELPGHDLTAAESEPFAPIAQVVRQIVEEVVTAGLGPVVLWGHSSGAPLAVETAKALEDRGVEVSRVIVAAQLVGRASDRRAHVDELNAMTATEIAADLSSEGGYTELGHLDERHAEQVGAAYRHDCLAAHQYLLDAMANPSFQRISAPLTVVVAADDPATVDWQHGYSAWELVANQVDLRKLDGGGHYFLRTRPREAAEIVRDGTIVVPSGANGTNPQPVGNGQHNRAEGNGQHNRAEGNGQHNRAEGNGQHNRAEGNGQHNRAEGNGWGDSALLTTTPLRVEVQPGRPPTLMVGGNGSFAGATSWVGQHRDALLAAVSEHGSVTIRGLGPQTAADVAATARGLIGGDLVVEREAFADRHTHPGGTYSSSEWPSNQQMCMHHELSYRLRAPGLMIFVCQRAPSVGGSIGLADSRAVLNALPPDLAGRFSREGWILARSYTDEIGQSVAEAFGTDDRHAIESYCRQNAIEFDWQPDGGLRTTQRRGAIVAHPLTGQPCWFNQIAFLNEWTMNPEVREFLVGTYGPDGLPFTTRFGNGDPIGADIVQTINDAYDANTTRQALQTGDMLIVDNIGTAHSREPFEGQREVLVAMGNEIQLTAVT